MAIDVPPISSVNFDSFAFAHRLMHVCIIGAQTIVRRTTGIVNESDTETDIAMPADTVCAMADWLLDPNESLSIAKYVQKHNEMLSALGWTYGPLIDSRQKQHPYLVPGHTYMHATALVEAIVVTQFVHAVGGTMRQLERFSAHAQEASELPCAPPISAEAQPSREVGSPSRGMSLNALRTLAVQMAVKLFEEFRPGELPKVFELYGSADLFRRALEEVVDHCQTRRPFEQLRVFGKELSRYSGEEQFFFRCIKAAMSTLDQPNIHAVSVGELPGLARVTPPTGEENVPDLAAKLTHAENLLAKLSSDNARLQERVRNLSPDLN